MVSEKEEVDLHFMRHLVEKEFNKIAPFSLSSQYALLTSLQVVRAIKDLACVIFRTPAASFFSFWFRTAMLHVGSANVRGNNCLS